MVAGELCSLNLDVYDTKEGWWTPDHGVVVVPDGWELLLSGDAFITRRVKAAGEFWNAWRPRGKNRSHRRRIGLIAPVIAITEARVEAERTEVERAQQRERGARQRAKAEASYQVEFATAVAACLDFAPEHRQLAETIAAAAAAQAVEVGSDRVGRTKLIPLEQRAALAARATIRHRYTDYENDLIEIDPYLPDDDPSGYRTTKQVANHAVDEFLHAHRVPTPPQSAE